MIDIEAARRTIEKAKQAGKIIAAEPLPMVAPKPRKKHLKKSQNPTR